MASWQATTAASLYVSSWSSGPSPLGHARNGPAEDRPFRRGSQARRSSVCCSLRWGSAEPRHTHWSCRAPPANGETTGRSSSRRSPGPLSCTAATPPPGPQSRRPPCSSSIRPELKTVSVSRARSLDAPRGAPLGIPGAPASLPTAAGPAPRPVDGLHGAGGLGAVHRRRRSQGRHPLGERGLLVDQPHPRPLPAGPWTQAPHQAARRGARGARLVRAAAVPGRPGAACTRCRPAQTWSRPLSPTVGAK